jgi:cytochrome c6
MRLHFFVKIAFFYSVWWIGCQSSGPEQVSAPDPGEALFRKNCVTCHGADGRLGLSGAKDLTKSDLSLEDRMTLIAKGRGLMTPFEGILTPEEIAAVARYTIELKTAE